MNWRYDNPPLTEGTEIIAEFYAFRDRRILHLRRVSTHWVGEYKPGGVSSYPDDYITIIAWMPYTKPTPPEKPQDCPFCGSKMRVYENAYDDWIAVCSGEDCEWRIPFCDDKEEAIEVLNSIEVKKK